MKRFILSLLFLSVFAGVLRAAEAEEEKSPLPFWGINSKDFYADTPRPISIPGAAGALDYYWYWTFKFKFNTNLDELKRHYEEANKRLDKVAATSEVEMLQLDIQRIERTLQEVNNIRMYVTLSTDTGQNVANTSDLVVRNLVEKQLGKKLYTTLEIANLKVNDIEETYDPEYGKGRWVSGIAVFPELPQDVRQFEIRVNGLGKRILPLFLPGRPFYPESTVKMETALQPTMRRSLRYFYRRIGQGAEVRMTPVMSEERRRDWLWIWPLQIQAGRFRELDIERASGLKRKYIYAPYYIHNNTHVPQRMEVVEAGFAEDIEWGGESLRIIISEKGDTDARWKVQALREIEKRLSGGAEEEFARANEAYPITLTDVDMEKYYRENFKDSAGNPLEYIPSDPQVQEDRQALIDSLKAANQSGKMAKELEDQKSADIQRKLKFLPEDGAPRLFKGTIEPGKLASGLFIIHWGVDDLDAVVTTLIKRLQAQAINSAPAADKALLAEYAKLCKENPNPDAPWARPAEPPRSAIEKMLVEQATAALQEKGVEVTEEDAQRYGALAPVGAWINYLAWQRLVSRADEKGITDAYFKVITSDTPEMAVISSSYRKFLAPEREALPEIPDEFKDEGTRAGTGVGGVGTTKTTTEPKKDDAFTDVW